MKKQRKGKKGPIHHWSTRQDLSYYFFLVLKGRELDRNKKSSKLYADMARYVGTRDSTQCRTHHEKKLGDLKDRQNPERDNLRKFFYQAYKIRRLGVDYLRYELQEFIKELRDQKGIKKIPWDQLDYLQGGIDGTLQVLDLDGSAWEDVEPTMTGLNGECEQRMTLTEQRLVERREMGVGVVPQQLQYYQDEDSKLFFSFSNQY